MPINQILIQEAENILQPPAPPASPIKDIKRATLKTLMTVCGTISEDEEHKTVFINGKNTALKSITLKDSTDDIKVTLWREATLFKINIGEYVMLTHVTVHECNGQKILNTTRHTKIQVTTEPQEILDLEIHGVENTNGNSSTITTKITNTDSFNQWTFKMKHLYSDLCWMKRWTTLAKHLFIIYHKRVKCFFVMERLLKL
ncbi:uncharacterized protein LOC144774705 [Lissotriton helveticus]